MIQLCRPDSLCEQPSAEKKKVTLFKTIHNLTNVIPMHWAQTIVGPSYFIPTLEKEGCGFFSFFSSLSLFFTAHWFTSLDPLWIGKKGREKKCFICQQKGGKWSMANAHSSCGQFFFKFYTNRHFFSALETVEKVQMSWPQKSVYVRLLAFKWF